MRTYLNSSNILRTMARQHEVSTNFVVKTSMLNAIQALFSRHALRSVFQPRSCPKHGLHAVFALLLSESNWRTFVVSLELKVQSLQQESTNMEGGTAFTNLTDLRRRLARARGLLNEARQGINYQLNSGYTSWIVDGQHVSAARFWSERRSQAVAIDTVKAKSIDIRDIPDLLKQLEDRLGSLIRTVNEEIQMVIGSVQIEDARVMRRQTEWTVVLAVLAAIYLPMTLVTGIFGMNITEIGAEATAPDRWSVVRAWGIVFGSTMGSVLMYGVVRYMLHYRRVARMLLKRKMRKFGDGWLYGKLFAFNEKLRRLWFFAKIRRLRAQMEVWDAEAQKMEKIE